MRDHDKSLQIGELARECGKSIRALHLYEELGIIKPASRTRGGFRLYSRDSVQRVEWIDKLHALGFTLPQIRAFLDELVRMGNAPEAMDLVRRTFSEKLAEMRRAIARLTELEGELVTSLSYLEGCKSCWPARTMSACPTCDLPHSAGDQPPLLAGLHAD